jgi:hypothetical protein
MLHQIYGHIVSGIFKMCQSDHKSRYKANAKHLLDYFFVGLINKFVSGKSKMTLKMCQSDHKSRYKANAKHLLDYFFVDLLSELGSGKSKMTLKMFQSDYRSR